jgi:hypothetical protein
MDQPITKYGKNHGGGRKKRRETERWRFIIEIGIYSVLCFRKKKLKIALFLLEE